MFCFPIPRSRPRGRVGKNPGNEVVVFPIAVSGELTWFRSIMNVDRPTDTVSLVCIRVKILSVMPTVAESAGTKLPICARNTIKPTC